MLGAIFVGLSGMQAYAKGLKTISNNVANMNTLGYKASTISFSDLSGVNGSGLSYTSSQLGGSTGRGVKYNPERIDFKQGSFEQTDNALDLSILGNGFLAVKNDAGETYYTRTGQFAVDSNGYIANQNGDRLTILNAGMQPETINVNDHLTNDPEATKTISITQAIGSGMATDAQIQNVQVYDAMGSVHTWTIKLAKQTPAADPTKTTYTVKVYEGETQMGADGTISFGNLDGAVGDPASFSINAVPSNAGAMSIKLDFSAAKMNAGADSLLQAKADGHVVGSLNNLTVDTHGKLVLVYSNQQKVELGAIAIADFQDQQQLTRVGNGLFQNTGTAGFVYKTSGADGSGTLQSGQLEASNVDLTAEFGNLILIQRGFDASSQVVSATNDMIQALFGMRGHG